MQIGFPLGLLGLNVVAGQELSSLQEGLTRLCPTGVNLPGLSERDRGVLEALRTGGSAPETHIVMAAASLARCLESYGFLAAQALENAPGVRLFQESPVPLDRLSFPAFGGVDVAVGDRIVRFGGGMWSNKDVILAASQGRPTPTVFVQDFASPHAGLMWFEFLRNNVFVTKKTPTFVVGSEDEERALDEFLCRTYESKEPEALGSFPSPPHASLRKIVRFNDQGSVVIDDRIRIDRIRPHVYRITEEERPLGTLNLESFSRTLPSSPIPARSGGKIASRVRRQALEERHPGLWPIGTANGFATREETSGLMVWNRGKFVLVDPPSSTVEYLDAHQIPLDRLEGIILTHGHTDHCTDAVPRLIEMRPKVRLYTTRPIFDALARQFDLALGKSSSRVDFNYRNFREARPRGRMTINGMTFRFHETLHSLPALGFEIWNRKDLAVHFSGDTFADPSIFSQFGAGQTPHMTRERAFEILRHYFLLPQKASQKVPPVFLIEGGIPPLHTSPDLTRAYLDFLKKHLGVDTSRVFVYHISDSKAEEARVPKWRAGHEGWIDLSGYYT